MQLTCDLGVDCALLSSTDYVWKSELSSSGIDHLDLISLIPI